MNVKHTFFAEKRNSEKFVCARFFFFNIIWQTKHTKICGIIKLKTCNNNNNNNPLIIILFKILLPPQNQIFPSHIYMNKFVVAAYGSDSYTCGLFEMINNET